MIVGLADCNSFYASCEVIFEPKLRGVPLCVLSNNDGAVVAMSKEAKALKIPMGTPWFKLKHWAKAHGVQARSSNYELYGSISRRVHDTVARFAAHHEEYSIDESFFLVNEERENLADLGREIRHTIYKNIGVPVSIGFASTKTLSKLANHGAKRTDRLDGVCSWEDYSPERQEQILAHYPTSETWGIAGRLEKRLAARGIKTMLDLRNADPAVIKKAFSVVEQRIVYELRGIPCIELEPVRKVRQSIVSSRMFGHSVESPAEIEHVLAVYAQRATEKLRQEGSVAGHVSAFAASSPYGDDYTSAYGQAIFAMPTDDPIAIAKAVKDSIREKLRAGVKYVRAGVMLNKLSPVQSHSFLPMFQPAFDNRGLGELLDKVHKRHGDSAIGLGLAGLQLGSSFEMRREMLSLRATTHWNELATAYAR